MYGYPREERGKDQSLGMDQMEQRDCSLPLIGNITRIIHDRMGRWRGPFLLLCRSQSHSVQPGKGSLLPHIVQGHCTSLRDGRKDHLHFENDVWDVHSTLVQFDSAHPGKEDDIKIVIQI